MIKIIEFECTTFKTITKGALHTGSVPFVVCPKCGATHILVDQRLTSVQFNPPVNNPTPPVNKEEKKEEEKNESTNN